MKLTIDRSALLAALTPCVSVSVTSTKAVSKHGSMLLLHATNESTGGRHLTIRASRDFTSVRAHAEADVATPGSICVPAEEFSKRIALMPDGPIALSVSGSKFTIGKGVYHLRTIDADGFPPFPKVDADSVNVDGKTLAQLLAATDFAVEDDNPRGVRFDGVLFTTRAGTLVATSSDGVGRFARGEAPHAGAPLNTFIIGKAIDVLRKVTSESVSIAVSDRAVCVTMGSVSLAFNSPDVGEFPYDRLFSTYPANDGLIVKRADIARAVKEAAPDGFKGSVPIILKCSDGVLTLTQTSLAGDEATREIAANGEQSWSACVEGAYLRDALRSGEDDVILVAEEGNLNHPLMLRSGAAVGAIGQCAKKSGEEKAKVAA